MANADSRPDRKVEPRRVVQCNTCGCAVECSADELLRYTREGWPRCCGQVMAFFTEPSRPAADARLILPKSDPS